MWSIALNCPVQAIEVQSDIGCAWAMISAAIRGKSLDSGECGCEEKQVLALMEVQKKSSCTGK